jgi:hypothetical protein
MMTDVLYKSCMSGCDVLFCSIPASRRDETIRQQKVVDRNCCAATIFEMTVVRSSRSYWPWHPMTFESHNLCPSDFTISASTIME